MNKAWDFNQAPSALTGNLALLGVQARNGVEFAVEEINMAGGVTGQPTALRPLHSTSRRDWYMAQISATQPWSPSSAAIAATCMGVNMP